MKNSKHIWLLGTVVTLAIIIIPIILFVPDTSPPLDNPQAHLPTPIQHTSHADLMPGPYETGEDVTKAILYSVEQKYETGQAIPVTGGQVMLN